MLMLVAQYLDDETILKKIPFISPDEITEITERKAEFDLKRLGNAEQEDVSFSKPPIRR